MTDRSGSGSKLAAGLAAVTAAFFTRRLLSLVWRALVGREPPKKPESLDVAAAEALAWAIASGAAVGVARVLAQRKVAQTWHRATQDSPSEA